MIYEYNAFIEVPEKLGEDKMAEIDCAIAYFVEDEFGYPVEFSIVGQVDEAKGNCEIEKVVRCKDCVFARKINTHPNGRRNYKCYKYSMFNNECGKTITYEVLVDDNHYCAYGEREDED